MQSSLSSGQVVRKLGLDDDLERELARRGQPEDLLHAQLLGLGHREARHRATRKLAR